jgi:hypothetical protein
MSIVTTPFDLEARWPKAFEGLTISQRANVVQACAANWHKGWTPNEADIRNLADLVRGAISHEEYLARGWAIAKADLARTPVG